VEVLEDYLDLMAQSEKAEESGNYILAQKLAGDAVILSMDNLRCKINDEQAWYSKIKLESMADYQQLESELDQLVHKSVPDYLLGYHELKRYYNRHKLLEQGVVFKPLFERVMLQKDSAFLTRMLDHYLFLKDYNQSLKLLQRMHELKFDREPLEDRQVALGDALARRDAVKPGAAKPWEIMNSYTGQDNWYHSFSWSYKKTWLKVSGWKLKFWPIIWKK
jgi:hypothetical protein